MPILEIQSSDTGPKITKVCQICKTVDTISADALFLGNDSMASAIALPACSKCGAVETLIRTTDASVPPRFSGHRKVVNALANYLAARGKVSTAAAALAPAAPVGELYGKVAVPPPPPPEPTASPVALAQAALVAAQKALAAAQAAAKK